MEKNRVYISEENIDKIPAEQWEAWKKEGYHICLGLKHEGISITTEEKIYSELKSQIEKCLKSPTPSGENNPEVLDFL